MTSTEKIGGFLVVLFIQLSISIPAFCQINASVQDTASQKSEEILIINSYTEITQWSNDLMNPIFQTYTAQNSNIDIFTEQMNALLIDNVETLDTYKKAFVQKYENLKPRLIILLGNTSWVLLNEELKHYWKDVPILLCSEKEYIGPAEFYLTKTYIPENQQTLLKDYKGDMDLTVFQIHCDMRHTLSLIDHLCPKMEKLLFLSDKRCISAQYRSEMDRLMKKEYPLVKVEHLIAGDISNDHLISYLKQLSPNTCILFSSWHNKVIQQGNVLLSTDISKLLSNYSKVPVFMLYNTDIEVTNGLVGGYFQDTEEVRDKLIQAIDGLLGQSGHAGVRMLELNKSRPFINYPDLVTLGLDKSRCPSNTFFYNEPPTFWEENWIYMVIVASLLLYALWLKKLDKERGARVKAMQEYNSLFENMPIAYIKEELIYDAEGQVVDFIYRDVNPSYEKMLSPKKDIIGKKYSETIDFHPELVSLYNKLKDTKEVLFQYYWESKQKFLAVIISLSKTEGFVDVFCVDNTELAQLQKMLRLANHKLSAALDVASITPWKWDLEKKMILCDVNRPIEIMDKEGYTSEQQLSVPDSSYFSNICKEDRERVRTAYQQLIDGKVSKIQEEFRVITGKAHPVHYEWVEVQAAVDERNEKGEARTLVGSSLIITRRKAMETDLIRAKEQAEESNRLKSAFLANMSHEIRTPLNAIIGFSGMLAESAEVDEEERKEYVQIIENNNELLLQLINDILDLSKIESGVIEFIESDVDVHEVCCHIEGSSRMRNKNSDVQILYNREMPECCTLTDKNRLMQVIINMVNNAMKFTTKGSIQFGYRLQDADTLYFYVKDTGCGIASDKIKSIFERFVKLDNFVQGTGLGLAICKMIVEKMNGKIGADSVEGEGTTFWFTLPYKPVKKKSKGPLAIGELQPIDSKEHLVILIAEDNESNYKLYEKVLSRDYTLIHAWDGEEAVAMFKEYHPHLVLMDISMPKMNGYEATKFIRDIDSSVPVIAVTAFTYAEDEHRILNSGFSAYAAKPIQPGELRMQIVKQLQTRFVFL